MQLHAGSYVSGVEGKHLISPPVMSVHFYLSFALRPSSGLNWKFLCSLGIDDLHKTSFRDRPGVHLLNCLHHFCLQALWNSA